MAQSSYNSYPSADIVSCLLTPPCSMKKKKTNRPKPFDFTSANTRASDAASEHSQEWEGHHNNSTLRNPSGTLLRQNRPRESPEDFEFEGAQTTSSNTNIRSRLDASIGLAEAPHDFVASNPSIQTYLIQSSPWNSQSVNAQPLRRTTSSLLNPLSTPLGVYKSAPGSDIGSSGTGRNAADSGYLSRSARSHSSANEPVVSARDEVPGQLQGFRPLNAAGQMARRSRTPATETPRSRGSTAQPRDRSALYKCPECDEVQKCPSDQR
jgi:hypothetical protein